ncbi:hypothetical protein R83H12_03043 [Fibrobacteria bacterium R8-3-H12]
MSIKNSIQEIIKKIPKGKIFDSHYVINQLIAEHSDEYLAFASQVKTHKTATVHGLIAKEIKNLPSLVEQVEGEFWSDNIRGNASECAGWRRK